MDFIERNEIRYLTLDLFTKHGVLHGFVTRHGGYSNGAWSSLNLGGTTGDNPGIVLANHQKLFDTFHRRLDSMFDVWQVHGNEIVCSREPRSRGEEHQKGDGILTDTAELTLMMRFADCVPIFLYDPEHNAGGIVHAGWQGTVKNVIGAAIKKMEEIYKSKPHHVIAGIGPSIGPDDYEVGGEVIQRAEQTFKTKSNEVLVQHDGRNHFDLWQANRLLLEDCGVDSIEIAGISTFSNTQDWYSHRRESGKTGRFGAIFALPE
ncbi:MAG: peptidoglycan editing factor PgeF [Anaerolineae bacterium]|nr:peptidoglycan editing factor PgeF [Anaerolineae bacterium]